MNVCQSKKTSTGKGGQEGIGWGWVELIVWGASELSEESLADSPTGAEAKVSEAHLSQVSFYPKVL